MFVSFVFTSLFDSLLFLYVCEFCIYFLSWLSFDSIRMLVWYLHFYSTLFCFCMFVSFVFTFLFDSLLFLDVCEFCIYFLIWLSFVSLCTRVLYLLFYLTLFCFCMFVSFVFTSLFDSLLFLYVCEFCIYFFIWLSFVSVWMWVLMYESLAFTL